MVVDAGLSRVPRFSPRTGMTRLETVRVSRASADQRRGRAGRLAPGVCYRLWTRAGGRGASAPATRPEILEADLAPLALELAAAGVARPGRARLARPAARRRLRRGTRPCSASSARSMRRTAHPPRPRDGRSRSTRGSRTWSSAPRSRATRARRATRGDAGRARCAARARAPPTRTFGRGSISCAGDGDAAATWIARRSDARGPRRGVSPGPRRCGGWQAQARRTARCPARAGLSGPHRAARGRARRGATCSATASGRSSSRRPFRGRIPGRSPSSTASGRRAGSCLPHRSSSTRSARFCERRCDAEDVVDVGSRRAERSRHGGGSGSGPSSSGTRRSADSGPGRVVGGAARGRVGRRGIGRLPWVDRRADPRALAFLRRSIRLARRLRCGADGDAGGWLGPR